MSWWWPWRHRNGRTRAADAEARADDILSRAERERHHVERLLPGLSAIPSEEFLDRVSQAFPRRRP